MRFAINTLILLSASVSLVSCATKGPITNAEICAEIPFVDGPEGACVWTVTKEAQIIGPKEWKDLRPYMLMIHIDSWSEIRKDWLKACRVAGPECNVQLNSVDEVIQRLDSILKNLIK